MKQMGATSSLRRIGSPAVLLCLLALGLAAPAGAASPSPDPPPLGVAPEAPRPEPEQPVTPAPRSTAPAATQTPVVVRTVEEPVYVVREAPARTAPATKAPVRPKQAVKATPKPTPKPKPTAAVVTAPHDRGPVPLAAFVPSVEELNRGLVALAGGALAFVALGGAVMLAAARRQLHGVAP
jgi:outer membrane biosynthesis protein TonB